jgi:hypothetical protein
VPNLDPASAGFFFGKPAMNLRLILSALMLLLAGLSPVAFAATYQWKITSTGSIYNSPLEACDSRLGVMQAMGNYTGERSGFDRRSPTQYYCSYWNSSAKVNVSSWLIDRIGDGCPTGQVYDDTEGVDKCVVEEPPQEDCSSTQGEPFPAKGPDSPVISSGGRNYVADGGTPTACYEQCQYTSETGCATSCYFVKGSTTQGFCNYILSGTGQSCSGDSYDFATTGDTLNSATDPKDPAAPPSDPNDPGCPEGWGWSGTTCVKADPGDGTGSGEGNGDGDGGNDGGNSGGGDGSGDGNGNGSGNGEGNGSGSGNGAGNGNGNGEGDGEGECDPAQNPLCEGIPGPSGSLDEPKAGNWDDANDEWDKKVSEAKQDLKDAVKANIDQLKGAFDLQLSTGGGELPCESFILWNRTYHLCVANYSGQLSYMRLAMLLMAALIAAFVILKE